MPHLLAKTILNCLLAYGVLVSVAATAEEAPQEEQLFQIPVYYQGRPVPDATVVVRKIHSVHEHFIREYERGRTGSDGIASMAEVQPGDYAITITAKRPDAVGERMRFEYFVTVAEGQKVLDLFRRGGRMRPDIDQWWWYSPSEMDWSEFDILRTLEERGSADAGAGNLPKAKETLKALRAKYYICLSLKAELWAIVDRRVEQTLDKLSVPEIRDNLQTALSKTRTIQGQLDAVVQTIEEIRREVERVQAFLSGVMPVQPNDTLEGESGGVKEPIPVDGAAISEETKSAIVQLARLARLYNALRFRERVADYAESRLDKLTASITAR